MDTRWMSKLVAGVFALSVVGCADPIQGTWDGTGDSLEGVDAQLVLDSDGTGTLSYRWEDSGNSFDGDIEWEQTDKRMYEFQVTCSSVDRGDQTCEDVPDQVWTCEMNDDKDRLVCADDGEMMLVLSFEAA